MTTRARMLSRVSPPWCPVCRSTPGLDCMVAGLTARQIRRREKRELRWWGDDY